MQKIDIMTDEERSIYFMQKFRLYKSNEQYNYINCILQYASGCSSCGGRQSYSSIGGICIDQILYSYYKETGIEIAMSKLQRRVQDGKNIYTV